VSPARTDELIEKLFGLHGLEWTQATISNPNPNQDPPIELAILRGEGVAHCIVTFCHEPCKMAEPIEIPFENWTRVVPRRYILGGGVH